MYVSRISEQLGLGDRTGCWVELGQWKEWWNILWKGGNLVCAPSLWICIPVHCSSQGGSCKLGSPMQMRSACRRRGGKASRACWHAGLFPLTQPARTRQCKLCDVHTPTQLTPFPNSRVFAGRETENSLLLVAVWTFKNRVFLPNHCYLHALNIWHRLKVLCCLIWKLCENSVSSFLVP